MSPEPTDSPMVRPRSSRVGVRWLAVLLVLVALAFAVGLLVRSRSVVFWLGETVTLEGRVSSVENTVSIETDDWTYGLSPVDVSWTDAQGTLHQSGRPSCLVPGDFASTVRFAAVQVTVDAATWRQVVWVDCRGTPIDGAAAQAAP